MKKLLFVLVSLMIFTVGCRSQESKPPDDYRIKMGPDVKANLVVFFKKEATWKEILDFQTSVIGTPDETGTGFESLPGMMSVVRVEIDGFEGVAINFKPSATDEQRSFVLQRIRDSQIDYKTYVNRVPSGITDLARHVPG